MKTVYRYTKSEEINNIKVGTKVIVIHRECIMRRCEVCKKKFLANSNKRKNTGRGVLTLKIRPMIAVTCSKECSKIHKYILKECVIV